MFLIFITSMVSFGKKRAKELPYVVKKSDDLSVNSLIHSLLLLFSFFYGTALQSTVLIAKQKLEGQKSLADGFKSIF